MTQGIVQAARLWIGTPYQHQASVRGIGCDCLGLIRGIWRELIGQEPFQTPRYTPDWGECRQGDPLLEAANQWLTPKPINNAAPGDVILFRMRPNAVAKHLGVQTQLNGAAHFIHAYGGARVVESPLSTPWQRKIIARFTFPI